MWGCVILSGQQQNQTSKVEGDEVSIQRNEKKSLKQIFFGEKEGYPEDLDKIELRRQILTIAGPASAELLLTQLVSMVSNMMVGGLGTWAISAVGYTIQPKFLMMTMFQAMNVGATALVARYKGAGDRERANLAMHQSIMITFLLSIVFSVIGYVFARPLVIFMGAETEQAISAGTEYFQIQMLLFPISSLVLAITAILRGVGQTRVSMVYNIVANIVNVACGFLLINGMWFFPRLEIVGAAWAVNISQIVAFIIAAIAIVRGSDILQFEFSKLFHWKAEIIRALVKIGAPAMVEQLVMRSGMIIYTKTVTSLGEATYAAHIIANNIMSLSFMNGQAFGIAATSLLGQSLGRERADHGRAYVRRCRQYGMIVSIIMAVAFIFLGKQICGLYTDDQWTISLAASVLVVAAIMQPLQSSQLILAGALRGAGDTKAVAFCTFVGIIIIRPLVSLTLINLFNVGLIGAWIAFLLDQSIRSVYTLVRFNSGKWQKITI